MSRRKNTNAMKHGIFAQLLLKTNALGEEAGDYLELVSSLRRTIKPVDELEGMLVDKLAGLFFRLSRLYKSDFKVAPLMFSRVAKDLAPGNSAVEMKCISREHQVVIYSQNPNTDTLARHEAGLERNISKTFGLLAALRQMRQRNVQPPPPPALPGAVDE